MSFIRSAKTLGLNWDFHWSFLTKGIHMLYWAIVFLVVAIIAGALGFFGLAGMAMWVAKVLFFVFLALFIISLLAGGWRRRM
jgi:uncharacterized membrane protein YtjA (UPF0391 family)